jgi:periplasmic copper chaperone A
MSRPAELSLAAFIALAPGFARADAASAVQVEAPYVRETAPGQKNGAAFLVLKNSEAAPHKLVQVESPAAERAQLHAHVQSGGSLTMKQVPEVEVPGGAHVALAPGGLHVMLLGLRAPLRAGERVTLELRFEDGSHTAVHATVRALR